MIVIFHNSIKRKASPCGLALLSCTPLFPGFLCLCLNHLATFIEHLSCPRFFCTFLSARSSFLYPVCLPNFHSSLKILVQFLLPKGIPLTFPTLASCSSSCLSFLIIITLLHEFIWWFVFNPQPQQALKSLKNRSHSHFTEHSIPLPTSVHSTLVKGKKLHHILVKNDKTDFLQY